MKLPEAAVIEEGVTPFEIMVTNAGA